MEKEHNCKNCAYCHKTGFDLRCWADKEAMTVSGNYCCKHWKDIETVVEPIRLKQFRKICKDFRYSIISDGGNHIYSSLNKDFTDYDDYFVKDIQNNSDKIHALISMF